jgi:hypothetical protein
MAEPTSRSRATAWVSPASSAQVEKSARSVKTIASSRSPLPRPWASDRPCHTCSAHPDLAQGAGLLGGQRREAAAEHGGRLVAGERERVAVALVAGQPAAAEPEELDQAGVRVDALEEAAETAGRVLAHRADFIYARRASATSRA